MQGLAAANRLVREYHRVRIADWIVMASIRVDSSQKILLRMGKVWSEVEV